MKQNAEIEDRDKQKGEKKLIKKIGVPALISFKATQRTTLDVQKAKTKGK